MKVTAHILITTFLLVGFSSVTMAQSTDNATITANANVVQDMVVGNESADLDFNNILVNSAKFIDATDGTVDATVGAADGVTGGESRGYFSIEIISGTKVNLELTVPSALDDGDDNTLELGFHTIVDNSATDNLNGLLTVTKPTGTDPVSSITDVTSTNFTKRGNKYNLNIAFTMPTEGKVYLALGGVVTAAADQEKGTYSAEITLKATVSD